MIVSFSITNYRSFSTEETISLVASKRLAGNHDDHLIEVPGSKEDALRAAVIYGANGAGKSNLFKALEYLKFIALVPRKKNTGTNRTPFRFSALENSPSSLDLQFIADSHLYRFGVQLDDDRIIEEWLYDVVGGRQIALYERTTDIHGKTSVSAAGLKNESEKLAALATVGGPQNQSFLAMINANLDSEEVGESLRRVIAWFQNLELVHPTTPFRPLAALLLRDGTFRSFAGDFLRSAATGVDLLSVNAKEIGPEELAALGVSDDFPLRTVEAADGTSTAIGEFPLRDGSDLVVDPERPGQFSQIRIEAVHQNETGAPNHLDLAEESDGTQRLLNLIPALHHMQKRDAVYVIDEIDRSLHPILVKEFLAFFLKFGTENRSQIIVTTHESNLLNQDLLRRDEIWFAEKDQSGSTRLYSLLDFKVRNDLEIRKHYLQGRFGAVPFLGTLDSLLPSADRPK